MERQRKAKLSLCLFVVLASLLLPTFIPSAIGDKVSQDISVSVDNPYYLRGETVTLSVLGSSSMNYTLTIYDPLNNLHYQKDRQTNVNGTDTFTLPVQSGALSGTYTIEASNVVATSTTWTSVVEDTGYTSQVFPYKRQHKNINYTINAKGFQATSRSGNITIQYPSLPISFTVNSYANNMSFVERLKNTNLGIYIDLAYLFIHKGMKLVINGTIPQPTTYTFSVQSPKELFRKLNAIRDGSLVFDWSDMKKAAQAFSYNATTKELTVNIPKTFKIDPYVFEDGFESGDFSAWTSTTIEGGNTLETQDIVKHHGIYGAHAIVVAGKNRARPRKIFGSSYSTIYMREYIRFVSFPSSGVGAYMLSLYGDAGAGYAQAVLIYNDTGTVKWQMQYAYNDTYSTVLLTSPTPSLDTWYCIELKVVVDGTVGEVRFYLDGSEQLTKTGLNNTAAGNINQIAGAIDYVDSSSDVEVYYDCVVVSDAYIGPEVAPTIGEFQASATVYANQYFFLNASVNDVDGLDQIINATISIHASIVLKWDNATAAFSEQTDTNNYVTLDVASSVESETNSTAFKLSWYIKLNSFPAGSVDVLSANTKVWDAQGSGSGSTTGLFTFSYITLTLQARDASGTNLPKTVAYSGTLGNGTTLSSTNSDTSGLLALSTCYGTHTITTSWGSHTIDASRSISVTADATENIDTKIRRLDSGSNYLLFSLDNTDLVTPELVGTYDWRMESVTATGSIEFKMDNANWLKTAEPYSFTTGTQTWTSATGTWSFSSNTFTFTVDFSTQTLSMAWDQPEGEDGGGGGGGGGGGYTPPEEPIVIPIPIPEIPIVPVIPTEFLPPAEPALLSVGAVAIIGSIAFVIAYGEISKRNPSARKAFKNRAKHRKVKWPRKPKKNTVKWKK